VCDSAPYATIELPSDTHAPRLARRFLVQSLCMTHNQDALDDAVTLTSELVTNALLHGYPPIKVAVDCDGDSVHVQVHDAGPTLPVPRQPADDETGGRGLLLVGHLADAWGVESTADGKGVWFSLARQRADRGAALDD
jgi:anti-sigma regulatory factor (Ser/Thr protein kinase)